MIPRNKVILAALVFLGLLFCVWKYVSTPFGKQRITFSPANESCFSGGTTTPWRYCVFNSARGNNGRVVYLFHGKNLDEHVWNDDAYYTGMIQKNWEEKNVTPPTVVTVSFGHVWLLTSKNTAENSGLLDIFLNEIIPAVEQRIGKPNYRIVMGESMGGWNALAAGLKTKGVFNKIVSLCPPIYQHSPFASFGDIMAFFKRTGADPTLIFGIRTLAKYFAAKEEEWTQTAPLELIKHANPEDLPPIYLSCPLYDRYGNYEGSSHFAQIASQKKIDLIWKPLFGDHCAIDITSVADFLIK